MSSPSPPPSPTYNLNQQLLRYLGLAIAVGISGSLAVLAFHQLLLWLEEILYGSNEGLVANAARLAPGVRIFFPACGGLIAGVILQYFLISRKNDAGTDYMEVIAAGSD
ncbi:MAG: chloride channel protein, partial [Ferrovum sp.]|nr:chloride channel protein [Ferrovum sp.]